MGGDGRGKKTITWTLITIFALVDDAEVLQCQVQYWAHKMQYSLQMTEWVYIGLVNVC